MNVLITGGAGYLGGYYVKNLLQTDQVDRLVVYSRDELKHFDLKLELGDLARRVEFVIGDVRDLGRLNEVMNGIDLVIHSAALKQVDVCEENPSECLKTNVDGTRNVLESAKTSGVSQFIFISTDKAVEPVSVYGNSKQAGEKLVLKANSESIKTNVLRLGNLIGSPGSIADKIRKRAIKEITLYDALATRFVGNLEGAWELLEETMLLKNGGNMILPRLKSIEVKDLIYSLDPTIKIREGDPRTFEKSHEKLANGSEMERAVQTQKMLIIPPQNLSEDEALDQFRGVKVSVKTYSSEECLVDATGLLK